jgi:ubiquinone/menaquinone biosynthesis C-methylase UbiE
MIVRTIAFFTFFILIFISCSNYSKITKEEYGKRRKELVASFNTDTLLSKEIAAKINIQKGDTICDVGGGFGFSSAKLASYFPDVIFFEEDINKKLCNKKRFQQTFSLLNPGAKTNNYRFFTGTETQLPFPDKSFKCVTVFFCIHEFSQKNKMMEEIRRVTRDDGLLYIRENVYKNTPATDTVCKFPYLSETELSNLIKGNGFSILQDSTFMTYDSTHNAVTIFLECHREKSTF